MAVRLLLIDDDIRLAEMVTTYLAGRGYQIEHQATATAGLSALERAQPPFEAVILDVMLPDFDGFEACKRIRARSSVPILMLTARGDDLDRIVGLELGADDYLPKPFNPRELLARLAAILRRARPVVLAGDPQPPLRFGRLEIDRGAREVRVGGERRELTSRQFDMLLLLAERAGRVQTREQIMEAMKGEEWDAVDRSIDVHVSRIRTAIEDDPKHPRYLQTVRGAGYVFAPPRAERGDAIPGRDDES